MDLHDRDLYSKPLEIHNSLYEIIGWSNLDKVQDFRYLEFVLRVRELSRSNQTDVKIQLLIAYIEICQYRLLDMPPKDYKNLVCVNSYRIYICSPNL
jgi:hypothetical protein